MTLLDHLNLGGRIRFNFETRQAALVLDGQEVQGITCVEGDVWNLIHDNLAEFYTHYPIMILSRADIDVRITQRDREIVRTLVEYWDRTDGGLPGFCSYQDVADLCDKFSIPQPVLSKLQS